MGERSCEVKKRRRMVKVRRAGKEGSEGNRGEGESKSSALGGF